MLKSEVVDVVEEITRRWPHREVSEAMAKNYCEMLCDLGLSETKLAVLDLCKVSKWAPTVAEIRKQVGARRNACRNAQEGWGHVLELVGRVGTYRTPTFDDPIAEYATACIGWKQICSSQGDQIGYMRHAWIETYEQGVKKAQQVGVEALLVGAPRKGLSGLHEESRRQIGPTSVGREVTKLLKSVEEDPDE